MHNYIIKHPMTRHPWRISLLCAAMLIVTACSGPDEEEKTTSESNQAIVVDTIRLDYQDWQGNIQTLT